MPSDLASRYRRLMGDERLKPLRVAMCWTVVEPVTKPVDVGEVIHRLGGGRDEGSEQPVDVDDPNDRVGGAFYVGQVGSAVAILEVNGFQGSRPEVLRVLSDGARVHSVFWNVNAYSTFSYAVYGRTLVTLFRARIRTIAMGTILMSSAPIWPTSSRPGRTTTSWVATGDRRCWRPYSIGPASRWTRNG
jgi:hypothetical protein